MNTRRRWLSAAVVAVAAAAAFVWFYHGPGLAYAVQSARAAEAADHLPGVDELSATFEKIADIIKPSVVSISSVKKVAIDQSAPGDPGNSPFGDLFNDRLFQRFFSYRVPRNFIQRGLGTGVIVSSDGYILTNNHVVGDAQEVEVRLPDDRTLRAHVVGTDEKTDLAVLKVDAHGLHPAELGDSDQLRVGQWVVAAGNPFGLTSSVTAGIISATGRSNVGLADYEDFIQTDAAINPGNSGGPLVDLHGKVVGINTAIFSRSGGYMGIGFAIPSNMAHTVMDGLIQHGHVVRGWLGVEIQDLNAGLAGSFGYSGTRGALVSDVSAGSPADHAGIKVGDIITRFDGHPIDNVARLRDQVADTKPGRRVDVEVFRGGHQQTLGVEIAELGGAAVASAEPGLGREKLGMTLQTLTSDEAQQLRLDPDQQGVLVTAVEPLSPAERAGLRANDVITGVKDQPVRSAEALRRLLARDDLAKGVRLEVLSGAARHFVFLQTDGVS
jgi:serine protease Do